MRKSLLVSLLVLSSLIGCGGSEKKTEIVFIRHEGVVVRCADNIKVRGIADKPDGTTVMDYVNIGGFYMIAPDLKDKPVAQVVREIETRKPLPNPADKATLGTYVK